MMLIKRLGKIRSQSARKTRGGFTLIEVLLVIVIILMLAGALVVFVLPQQEGAEKNTTRLLLQNIESAIETYRLNMGRYPTTEQGLNALLTKPTFENEKQGDKWNGPYLKQGTKLEDTWGNAIRYELADVTDEANKGAARYKLSSAGPDGQPDTADDIKPHDENADGTTAGGTSTSD